MKKIIFLVSLFIIFVFLIVNVDNNEVTAQDFDGSQEFVCLEPDVSGYAYEEYLSPIAFPFEDIVIPEEMKILYDFDEKFGNASYYNLISLLSIDKNNVWLFDRHNDLGKIIRFSPETNEYDYFFPYSEDTITRWFQTETNEYYFIEIPYNQYGGKIDPFGIKFYKFNEDMNNFKKTNFPNNELYINGEINIRFISNLLEDERGHIWFTIFNQLVEYNPISEEFLIHQIFSDTQPFEINSTNIVINHNKIWFFTKKPDSLESDISNDQIYEFNFGYFDINTNEYVDDYSSNINDDYVALNNLTPPEMNNNQLENILNVSFLIDENENLWTNHLGYLTLKDDNYSWHSLLFSPLFIEKNFYPVNFLYKPEIFKPQIQIGDKIWFTSYRSIITLDTNKGEWCRIAVIATKEFFQNDLGSFIFMDNKIYQID